MQNILNKHFCFAIICSGFLLFSAYAHANTCNEGIGGTGITAETEGLGGTGIVAETEGLGGTGIKAEIEGLGGTGIVGVITGFASVCVNGVEAHFDSKTKVDIDGATASIDKLNIGDLVAIDAKGQGAEVSAQRISVIHAIVGRIEAINPAQNQIKIMGQTVQLSAVTKGTDNLKVGQNVAVSGFALANSAVQATRTDIVSDAISASISGHLIDGKVSGVPVAIVEKNSSNAAVQVSGNWDGKILMVKEVKQNAMDRIMRAGYVFDVQGVVYQEGNNQALYALGKQVYIESDTKIYGDKNLKNAVLSVRGKVDNDGRAVAKAVDYRPMDKVLERGGSQERPSSKSSKELEGNKKHPHKLEKEEHKALDKTEKLQRSEKPEKVEIPDKIDKPEKAEKPEKVEKPEKTEKPEKVGKVERVEKPEKAEKFGD